MVFLTVTLLKISSFQQNIVRHTKEQGSMTHTQEKKSTETVSEEVEMLVLLDKDLKSAIKNISKNYRKLCIKNYRKVWVTFYIFYINLYI